MGEEVEEDGDVEEVVHAVGVEIGKGVLVIECFQVNGEVEEVERPVSVQIKGAWCLAVVEVIDTEAAGAGCGE